MGAKKISKGKYFYKGYILTNHGYYEPDHCVWWEAVNEENGCADFHAHTKRELMEEIDAYDSLPYPEQERDNALRK